VEMDSTMRNQLGGRTLFAAIGFAAGPRGNKCIPAL
jgi:hypothetical protein